MKNKLSFILLLLVSNVLYGQKVKQVIDKSNREVYFVLKKDQTIKHGEFVKLYPNKNNVLMAGYYKNGEKDSIWTFFDASGEIIQKYNYSNKKLVFLRDSNKVTETKYKLINGTDNPLVTLDRQPVFLGGDDYLFILLAQIIQYPEEAAKNGKGGKVYISFVVDKNGKATNFNVLNSIGFGLDEEALRAVKSLPDYWIPGVLNGEFVDIELIYPISFRNEM
jgi:TonB family protein